MAARKWRIGMLTPSSNTALEPLTVEMLASLPDVSVHFSRLFVLGTSLSKESNDQFTVDAFVQAAKLLADARVNVIAWNGTSGSWFGLDWERRLCKAVEDETGIPTTGSTLAFFDAFKRFGVKRYSLAVPYVEDHTKKIIETYAAEGLECARYDFLGYTNNAQIDAVPAERLREQLRKVATPDADAIAVVCTNVPDAPFAEEIESALGIPVIDSITVTAWKCLTMLGIEPNIRKWGKLMRGDYTRGDGLATNIRRVLKDLLDATKASRTTFRVDLPERNITVQIPIAEALAEGVPTMMNDGSLKQRGSPTCQWLEDHRKPLIQEDLEHADPAPPRGLLDKYGAKAQMLAPVEDAGAMVGWVSVHYLPGPRPWTTSDVSALESAASRIRELLRSSTN